MVNQESFNNKHSPTSKRRVVICGSMSAYKAIQSLQIELFNLKVQSIIPDPEDEIKPSLTQEAFEEFKRRVSFAYIKKIRHPLTVAVLVVNLDKYGVKNYIGPNTFAEVAVAFAQGKRIYVYQKYPDIYCEELKAWRVRELCGDLKPLVNDYLLPAPEERQLSLFDGK